MNEQPRRTEPIFNLMTPLLFAHRGGALETPESTVMGFKHALKNARADVLELDIQLTLDGEFVVWHGPELNNVRIKNQPDKPEDRSRKKIYDFSWDELDRKAWVANPKDTDLSNVPQEEDRCLLRLSDFLRKFPNVPLNIEMKESFKRKINGSNRKGSKDNIKAFSNVLRNDPSSRTIIVVSAVDDHIDEFRELNADDFPTGLSIKEQLLLLTISKTPEMKKWALETSYSRFLSSKAAISKVREAGGSSFVFLTRFPFIPAIDSDPNEPKEEDIFEILDRCIDGIMTDRPKRLRQIMDKWIAKKQG